MDKNYILEQIRTFAAANGGRAPGQRAFEKATGIGPNHWWAKYWAKWSDAISEAGLSPNKMQAPYDANIAVDKFVALIRELGRFPVSAEVRLKASTDKSFPSHNTLTRHLGKQSERASFIKAYCEKMGSMEDVIDICTPHLKPTRVVPTVPETGNISIGYVYLIKSGRFYKIGSTNNPDRRQYEIGLQLPEIIQHVHSIETDDPSGIEAYWHNRFRQKRLRGEWFDLTPDDIRVFRRRKFM